MIAGCIGRTGLLLWVSVLIAACCTVVHAGDATKDQRQWWIDHYGLIDAKKEPLVARAEKIFDRVAAAADKKGNRLPRLVVIGGSGDPYALAIRDGSVILTLEGLKICYRNAAPETGDSRLAFLIGHELAHLAKDDFWHSSAFAAVMSYPDDAQVRRILTNQLEKTGGSLDFIKTQELQADSYGIIYMTMAGFDPKAIIGRDDANFFRYWVSQITGKLAYGDAAHVSPEARAEFLRAELRPVIDALARFNHGVQLYQIGKYVDAASCFESFIETYPGREVYNNLGASRYQLALESLSACNDLLTLLKLPMLLDSETTARRLYETTAGESAAYIRNESYQASVREALRFFGEAENKSNAACIQSTSYQTNLREAIRFFEEAAKKDVTYLPARINLSTALILSGDYARAISVADEALRVDSGSPAAMHNEAVAEHLFARKNKADDPDAPAAAYGDVLAAGLATDPVNFSFGPTVVWWPFTHCGIQVSYGRGTFTSGSVRGLIRFGEIAGVIPYAGLGFLSVENDATVVNANVRFSGRGGELSAGVILPLSRRLSLMAAVTADTIKLEENVSQSGNSVPVTMNYSPLSVSASLVYCFFR